MIYLAIIYMPKTIANLRNEKKCNWVIINCQKLLYNLKIHIDLIYIIVLSLINKLSCHAAN